MSTDTDTTTPTTVADLPMSARFVYYVLKHEGPLTAPELQDRTWSSPGSVYPALDRLVELGYVRKQHTVPGIRGAEFHVIEEAGP